MNFDELGEELDLLVGWGLTRRKLVELPLLMEVGNGSPAEAERVIRAAVERFEAPEREAYEHLLMLTRRGSQKTAPERRRRTMELLNYELSLRDFVEEEEPRMMERLAAIMLEKPPVTTESLIPLVRKLVDTGDYEHSELLNLSAVRARQTGYDAPGAILHELLNYHLSELRGMPTWARSFLGFSAYNREAEARRRKISPEEADKMREEAITEIACALCELEREVRGT